MKKHHSEYWFPAKTYGYGWGLPVAWQGWVALILVLVFVIGGARSHLPENLKLAVIFIPLVLFIWLCWFKGEKLPRRSL